MLLAGAMLTIGVGNAGAATLTDPANDILATFQPGAGGGAGANLDILSFSVAFDGVSQAFRIGATFSGPVNGDNATLFVIGVNTGSANNHPFGPGTVNPTVDPDPQDLNHAVDLGENAVSFNRTFIVHQGGTDPDGTVTLTGNGAPLTDVNLDISGDGFSLIVPLSDFPPAANGFRPQDFGFNLWTRNGLGDNHQVADFAVHNGLLSDSAVPEPASWALMIAGFGLAGAALRARKRGGAPSPGRHRLA
jgi:hypothetical protein